jgi:hypothetical protein
VTVRFEARHNGVLPLALGFRGAYFGLQVIGGPFDNFKPGVNGDFGVCVRAEQVPSTAHVKVPIHDFRAPAPDQTDEVDRALKSAFEAALTGKRVWVGCMGGWGRTGLFLALMAKVAGAEDPVGYVRRHYAPRAVETPDQLNYVKHFDVDELRSWLCRRAWTQRWLKAVLWWQ